MNLSNKDVQAPAMLENIVDQSPSSKKLVVVRFVSRKVLPVVTVIFICVYTVTSIHLYNK